MLGVDVDAVVDAEVLAKGDDPKLPPCCLVTVAAIAEPVAPDDP